MPDSYTADIAVITITMLTIVASCALVYGAQEAWKKPRNREALSEHWDNFTFRWLTVLKDTMVLLHHINVFLFTLGVILIYLGAGFALAFWLCKQIFHIEG
jgi:hypothetical protein